MEKKQTLPHLDKMSEELLNDIKTIAAEGKAQISDKIMERLRGETIFLPQSYVESKKEATYCTIDPEECLDLTLSQIEEGIGVDSSKIDMLKQGIVAIKGNSLGPYYPKEYFKETTFKVLWLLKESYIEWPSFKAGDRGGHNQAAEYVAYGVEGNDTHQNLVAYTRAILSILGEIAQDAPDEEVMEHICVLEANHFPGLAFNSTKTNDEKPAEGLLRWARSNKGLLKLLIEFYEADIVIGCHTFMGEFASNNNLLNYLAAKENAEERFLKGEEWEYILEDKPIQKTIFGKQIIRPWSQDEKGKNRQTFDGKNN